jgi:acetyl-CoA carboxylase beta subunit
MTKNRPIVTCPGCQHATYADAFPDNSEVCLACTLRSHSDSDTSSESKRVTEQDRCVGDDGSYYPPRG